jgi:thioredoxin 1
MPEIRHVTDENFEELVLKSERPTVVDFWAVWCGPCKMVAPEMEKLAAKYDGKVDVVKVDVDANPRLSQAFNIMSIPTIAYFKPGATPQGVVGFRPLEQLEVQFGLAEFENGAPEDGPSEDGATETASAKTEAPASEAAAETETPAPEKVTAD